MNKNRFKINMFFFFFFRDIKKKNKKFYLKEVLGLKKKTRN
jgi:hypothetical protein